MSIFKYQRAPGLRPGCQLHIALLANLLLDPFKAIQKHTIISSYFRFPTDVFVTLTAFGIWSTYCGLMTAFKLSSRILVKKFCNSDPRKKVRISFQSGGSTNRPRFGFSFPAKIFKAVDFPIPLVPTKPSTCPGRGVGSLWSLNELGPKRCVVSLPKLLGKLMIVIASNGHF